MLLFATLSYHPGASAAAAAAAAAAGMLSSLCCSSAPIARLLLAQPTLQHVVPTSRAMGVAANSTTVAGAYKHYCDVP
jgi:hypothetical protein